MARAGADVEGRTVGGHQAEEGVVGMVAQRLGGKGDVCNYYLCVCVSGVGEGGCHRFVTLLKGVNLTGLAYQRVSTHSAHQWEYTYPAYQRVTPNQLNVGYALTLRRHREGGGMQSNAHLKATGPRPAYAQLASLCIADV